MCDAPSTKPQYKADRITIHHTHRWMHHSAAGPGFHMRPRPPQQGYLPRPQQQPAPAAAASAAAPGGAPAPAAPSDALSLHGTGISAAEEDAQQLLLLLEMDPTLLAQPPPILEVGLWTDGLTRCGSMYVFLPARPPDLAPVVPTN